MASSRGLVVVATVLLFLVWSNSFIAMSYLLGREAAGQRLDWLELTTARFAPVTLLAGLYCFGARGSSPAGSSPRRSTGSRSTGRWRRASPRPSRRSSPRSRRCSCSCSARSATASA
ncbi:MAG: hypothetical protein L6Q95_17995 [Planctomycetes bacterium]|nr:hypothetical protein [Planctomycetota bacterium]